MINWDVFDGYANARHEAAEELAKAFPVDPIEIADIGACDGLSTVQYLRMWPKTRACLFEPVAENFGQCVNVLSHYEVSNRCRVFQVALSNDFGTEDFYVSRGQAPNVPASKMDTGNKSSSLLPPKDHLKIHPWCKFNKIRIKTAPAEYYLFYYALRPEFLHIDVQGAEMRVLNGFGKYLDYVKAIWAEVATVEMYQHQPLRGDLTEYLSSKGFRVCFDTCGNKRAGDCLFVRR